MIVFIIYLFLFQLSKSISLILMFFIHFLIFSFIYFTINQSFTFQAIVSTFVFDFNFCVLIFSYYLKFFENYHFVYSTIFIE